MATSRARTAGKRQAASVDLDTEAFAKGLRTAVAKIKIDTEADLQRLGLRIQNEARRLCPVDTGRLRASIIAVDGRDAAGIFVKVGTNVSYAPFVEYGTSRSPAQPFLRPAVLLAARSMPRKGR